MADFVSPSASAEEPPGQRDAPSVGWDLGSLNVSGVLVCGAIDLDRPPGTDAIGYVCIPDGCARAFVSGQVVVIRGVMRVSGELREARGEFRLTNARRCRDGRCFNLVSVPTLFRSPST